MAVQYSVAVNNARLDAIESTIGTNVGLLIYSGLPPATCAAAPTGTLLVAISLPADWMAAASSASKAKSGTWSGTAVGTGTAGYFRIASGSPTDVAGIQGLIETTGGSPTGDMGLDNTSISSGQTVTVSTFTITAANQ
jgi:hypothetical protein